MFLILYVDENKINKHTKNITGYASKIDALNANINKDDIVRVLINSKNVDIKPNQFLIHKISRRNIIN